MTTPLRLSRPRNHESGESEPLYQTASRGCGRIPEGKRRRVASRNRNPTARTAVIYSTLESRCEPVCPDKGARPESAINLRIIPGSRRGNARRMFRVKRVLRGAEGEVLHVPCHHREPVFAGDGSDLRVPQIKLLPPILSKHRFQFRA